MSATNSIQARPVRRFFDLIPTPVLVLALIVLGVVLAADLLVPDPIPLLDEAALLFFFGTAFGTLRDRRRSAGAPPPPSRLEVLEDESVEAPRAKRVAGEWKAVAAELARHARALRKDGRPLRGLSALEALPGEAKAAAAELNEHGRWFARKDHDPWQVEREILRQERAAAEAEAGGDARARHRAEERLSAARARWTEVRSRLRRRSELVAELERRTAQGSALAADLRAALDERTSRPATSELDDLEPRFALVRDELLEEARATAELERVTIGAERRASPERGAETSRRAPAVEEHKN